MPSKRMVPEQQLSELSDEMVRLLALKDGVIAKLREQRDRARRQRIQKEAEVNRLVPFYEACISARAEIAALTEQRDRAMKVVEAARECLECWDQIKDSLGWLAIVEHKLPKLRAALDAEAAAEAASLPESPIDG